MSNYDREIPHQACTLQKKFPVEDFFSKCDKIRKKLQIWSHLLKKFLIENLHFLCSDDGMFQVCFKLDFNFLNTIKITQFKT